MKRQPVPIEHLVGNWQLSTKLDHEVFEKAMNGRLGDAMQDGGV